MQLLEHPVWVRTGQVPQGPGNMVLPSGTAVFANPQLNASAGGWTPIGQAAGHGSPWLP